MSDSVFFQTNFSRLDTGDLFQRYDNRNTGTSFTMQTDDDGKVHTIRRPDRPVLTFHFSERQDPGTLLAGWQHEWSPGNHTLLLLSRLANRQMLTEQQTEVPVVSRDASLEVPAVLDPFIDEQRWPKDPALRKLIRSFAGKGIVLNYVDQNFDLDYRANFETYSADLQQIVTLGPSTTVLGGRYQHGEFETRVALGNYNAGRRKDEEFLFGGLPVRQAYTVDLYRFSLYAYETLHVTRWLSLTGGVTYDHVDFPQNFRFPPINGRGASDDEVLPKAGVIAEPWRGAVIRGAYTRSLSGASFEESVRLEPTQVAGFVQSSRSVAPESLVGPSSGSHFETFNGSFEQRLPSRTYLGFEYDYVRQNLDRTVGVFDGIFKTRSLAILPSRLDERGHYTEQSYTGTINQLIGDRWSLGARYTLTHSELDQHLPKIMGAADFTSGETALKHLVQSRVPRQEANLHVVSLFALYNDPSGFFVRGEANWYRQDSDEFSIDVVPIDSGATVVLPRELRSSNHGLPGDDFWQFNAFAGYRFHRNQCEVSVGGLNLTGEDYRLNPLSPYAELPRDRTVVVRCKLNF